jgi:hypothetical protein
MSDGRHRPNVTCFGGADASVCARLPAALFRSCRLVEKLGGAPGTGPRPNAIDLKKILYFHRCNRMSAAAAVVWTAGCLS